MKDVNVNGLGTFAIQALRTLCVCGITLMLAASPAWAGGSSNATFSVGIRIQSKPPTALTPEQLNERNKMLYEEQKKVAGAGTQGSVNPSLSTTEARLD